MKNYAREIWNFYGSWKFVLTKFKNFETRLIPKSFYFQNIIYLSFTLMRFLKITVKYLFAY